MKPRLFIGSSIENLTIANALNANLEYDATVTVWNKGIFNLSSNTLIDLLNALNNFDFAIFVFQADDLTTIRDLNLPTVRDNIIFELGLFLGRLGKERVFYLIDRNAKEMHLPTDLIGLTPGSYDSQREDGNLQAALTTFCYDVTKKLKAFIFENLSDLQNESITAKKIAIDMKPYWELTLAKVLLETKLKSINLSYDEIINNKIVQLKRTIDYHETYKFIRSTLSSTSNFLEQFKIFLFELNNAVVNIEQQRKALEIKKAVDLIILICKEFVGWEFELNSLIFPVGLEEIKELLKGSSKLIIDEVNSIPPQLEKIIDDYKKGQNPNKITFQFNLDLVSHMRIQELFKAYLIEHHITDIVT